MERSIMFNPYDACFFTDGYIAVDESILRDNITYQSKYDTSRINWQPLNIKEYSEVKKVHFDIETLGLYPTDPNCRVTFIGLYLDGYPLDMFTQFRSSMDTNCIIISSPDEVKMLHALNYFLTELYPEIITGHYMFAFDLNFIYERCVYHGVECLWAKGDFPVRVTSASVNGQVPEFMPFYWKNKDGTPGVFNRNVPSFVDTIHLAGQEDKIFAKMEYYSLKYLAKYVGFRSDEGRLELSATELCEYWRDGRHKEIIEYLIYDLQDQKAIADYFVPGFCYYQSAIVTNMTYQNIAVASPAKKWNNILDSHYRSSAYLRGDYYLPPQADEKLGYKGGLTGVRPGIYKDVHKIDVSAMYPSIMTVFGLFSGVEKDPDHFMLHVMSICTTMKTEYKKLAKAETDKVKKKYLSSREWAAKIFINGGYGFCGTGMYPYNSMRDAALVCAYGRVLIEDFTRAIQDKCTVIEIDTDGIYFAIPDGSPYTATDIHAIAQQALPPGILIDLDENLGACFMKAAKNYVFFETEDSKPQIKGLYRKRNRSLMQKEFPLEYIRKLIFQGDTVAEEYYKDWYWNLKDNDVDLSYLMFHQRIGKADKRLSGAGLGVPGDKVKYIWGEQLRFHKKTGKKIASERIPVAYDSSTVEDIYTEWYISDLDALKADVDAVVEAKITSNLQFFDVADSEVAF